MGGTSSWLRGLKGQGLENYPPPQQQPITDPEPLAMSRGLPVPVLGACFSGRRDWGGERAALSHMAEGSSLREGAPGSPNSTSHVPFTCSHGIW